MRFAGPEESAPVPLFPLCESLKETEERGGFSPAPPGLSNCQILRPQSPRFKEKPGYRRQEFASGSAAIDTFVTHQGCNDQVPPGDLLFDESMTRGGFDNKSFWERTIPSDELNLEPWEPESTFLLDDSPTPTPPEWNPQQVSTKGREPTVPIKELQPTQLWQEPVAEMMSD